MNYTKPFTLLSLCMILGISCAKKKKPDYAPLPEASQIMNGDKYLPTLVINNESFTPLGNLHFRNSVGGEPIEEETLVKVKYDAHFLEIKFECRDNPRTDQNYFTEDNTPMFNQEVFEIFISKGKEPQENYIEIQLNPNNAMFLAKIKNQFKTNKEFSSELLDPNVEGIEHTVIKDNNAQTWSGHMKIPLSFLQYPKNTADNVFRLNFYRIISQEDHFEKDWRNSMENSTFACWSPTMAQRPNFHRPECFGYLILD